MPEQINSIHGGHAIVHHKTSDLRRPVGREKTHYTIKGAYLEALGLEHEVQRSQNRRIVLDNENEGSCPRRHFDRPIRSAPRPPRAASLWLAQIETRFVDITSNQERPALMAIRTSSERLVARIFFMTLAR